MVLRDSCPGPQVTSGSVSLPSLAPLRALAPSLSRSSGPDARARVPAAPADLVPPHGHPQAAGAAAAAGSGVRQGDKSGAGPERPCFPAGGTPGPGAPCPRSRRAPLLRGPLAPRWEQRKGRGWWGGQCQAGLLGARGLAIRYLLLGASRPPSLRVPG